MTVGKEGKEAKTKAPDKIPNVNTMKDDADVLQLQLLYDLKAQMDQMQAKINKMTKAEQKATK